jgi:hypothetical protein
MRIYYGIIGNCVDVTEICVDKLLHRNVISIPFNDHCRCYYFNDPVPYVVKKIFVEVDDIITVCDNLVEVQINIVDRSITRLHEKDVENKLKNIQHQIKLNYGVFEDELPEQKMVVRCLKGNEKVLELGGNIGRNSLVIASILQQDSNLVTLECCEDVAKQLAENRDWNHASFHIEPSALSKRPLISDGWFTMPCETLLPGYNFVSTITFEELERKYNIQFDTLVLDCESAFYYIVKDMPEMLTNINLIIMENDYSDLEQKTEIDDILKKYGFYRHYVESGGWGPCAQSFYEVWKK